MVVRNMADAVQHRVAEMDIGRRHVDLRAQAPFAVGVLPVAHLVEDLEVAFGRGVARRRRAAGLLRHAAILLPFLLAEIAAVGLSAPDQLLGDGVHPVEHVARVVEPRLAGVPFARPFEAEPPDVVLDVLGVLVRLLSRIRVVESQMAFAAEQLRHPEIDADRLGVSDVNVAVRLRREARDDLPARAARRDIRLNPLAQKVAACIRLFHGLPVTSRC